MASIDRRPPRTSGGAVSFRVRYRDPSGAERSKTFKTRAQAKVFQASVEADMARGTYVDQALGKVTLSQYAEEWLSVQTFSESTRQGTAIRLRNHVLPALGSTPVSQLRPSQIQAWVRAKQNELAPRTVRLVFSTLSSVLSAAVDDERIAKNPCRAKSIRLPKLDDRKIVPWTDGQVVMLRSALPERYAPLLSLTTGLGLRQGEAFGLALSDIDFLRQTVRVQRQVAIVGSRLVFALPKNRKVREVPLSSRLAEQLAAYLQQVPAQTVELPWENPEGRPVEAQLLLVSRECKPLNRNYVNSRIWKPALSAAGLPHDRVNMMHGGRHYFASIQLEAGTSIRALSDYLGHADPGFTLRTYTHLMPQAEDKAKRAVDDVFERLENASISPLRGPNVAPGVL